MLAPKQECDAMDKLSCLQNEDHKSFTGYNFDANFIKGRHLHSEKEPLSVIQHVLKKSKLILLQIITLKLQEIFRFCKAYLFHFSSID